MFCKNCGQELRETAKFCMKCGTVTKYKRQQDKKEQQDEMEQFFYECCEDWGVSEVEEPCKDRLWPWVLLGIILTAFLTACTVVLYLFVKSKLGW